MRLRRPERAGWDRVRLRQAQYQIRAGPRPRTSHIRRGERDAMFGNRSSGASPGSIYSKYLSERSSHMSDAENLYGEKHVRRYRETGGEVGHRWKRGSKILLLTTQGRRSGEPRTKPLIYEQGGDRYVIVASKGGAPEHPGWYRNLEQDPNVELQVLDEM